MARLVDGDGGSIGLVESVRSEEMEMGFFAEGIEILDQKTNGKTWSLQPKERENRKKKRKKRRENLTSFDGEARRICSVDRDGDGRRQWLTVLLGHLVGGDRTVGESADGLWGEILVEMLFILATWHHSEMAGSWVVDDGGFTVGLRRGDGEREGGKVLRGKWVLEKKKMGIEDALLFFKIKYLLLLFFFSKMKKNIY